MPFNWVPGQICRGFSGELLPHKNFKPAGVHTNLSCAKCHSTGYPGKYAGVSQDNCYACHSAQHAKKHPTYPTDCKQCHTSSAWLPATAIHKNFKAAGVHTNLSCAKCHSTGYPGKYAGVSQDNCYTCHSAQHSQKHPTYPTDCKQCHTSNAWLPATAIHKTFKPVGVHVSLSCNKCHSTGYPGKYAGVSQDNCYTCHSAQHSQKHPTYPIDCKQCHSSNAWLPATAIHKTFKPVGVHVNLSCNKCHSTGYPGKYAGVSQDNCYACHSAQHSQKHPTYPTDCKQCHSSNA
ncbi:MAG: hypothetical protein HY756_11610, partial [Nitrospirae bacterium]|nr:hypothetical protein [Nitrospirota bacterium]